MLCRGSRLLILDEATSSLDPDTDHQIGRLVRQITITITIMMILISIFIMRTSSFLSSLTCIGCSCERSFKNVQYWQLRTGCSQLINNNPLTSVEKGQKWYISSQIPLHTINATSMWLVTQAVHSDGKRQDLCSWQRSSCYLIFQSIVRVSRWLSLFYHKQ